MPESLFWCFLVNFPKFVRTPFFAEQRRTTLLLIIAVSTAAKEVFLNETVNNDTKTKAYVLI